MLLLIDNYDSFTYNLYQFIGEIYPDIKVLRNDQIEVSDIILMKPDGIVLSPGPGRPENAGICIDVIEKFGIKIPILGICLGHQAIGYAYGAKIIKSNIIKHGKTSIVTHNRQGLFNGIKNPIKAMRYHSLIIDKDSLTDELEITAEAEDGTIMGIKHKKFPVYGLQFHPESILTEEGKSILKNYVEGICNVKGSY
ncbi:anthranilate synthase component II [Thermoanaerobacterium thermosaccharolyticum]|uniref:Glutamine amidotransferase of anthranilate synthase n=2 Tax=Thermoanaerobacterium thermosaccharolyticum TaxID=1517 RepID=D9TPR2_THETC|nr:aminodeoxychorismate/anthranilate synthase component II [Thermoanaerobacterium thermosaccharolyticum]ADL68744.1 glutamine amidotransferase of anthranilate synthase [Thermoanaerobacterium thermosaccharolyticum DSM 571]AST56280.1 anthranilate synthase component II [Thermoanaerobacterium thermosaccharolyticum]AST59230.1 anthranilate synthase subunit II [Thermoanaerobacterium thermosaccharolyticum]MBE0067875.1 aminodeoxychorismate/anthranilate synthase component II [Thermoanaerobacterium thermos